MKNTPYIILSTAMTIDGKIASKKGDPEISDEDDWKEVHKLRSNMDAIMVGKGTILKDNPKLHIKYYKHEGFYRIIVDSNLSIPIDSNVINYEPKLYPTIICSTKNAPKEKIKNFEAKNVKILQAGSGTQVDIKNLLPKLHDMGIHSIILEGGGTLNWSFIKNDLIDEIRLTIAPWIVGGRNATSLVEGEGFEKMVQAPRFKLVSVTYRNDYAILKYLRR